MRCSSEHPFGRELANHLREPVLFDVAMRGSSELRRRPLDQMTAPERSRDDQWDNHGSFGIGGLDLD